MENNRIRKLRKNLSLFQENPAEKIETTQQAVSRKKNNANDIPSDLLIEISKQFNVTTDYILGISDVKRDYNRQYRINQKMYKCYDIVIRYQNLSKVNQKTLRCILECLEQAQKESKEASTKENGKMLRIAICDDDLKFTEKIEALVFQESQQYFLCIY